TGGTYVVKPDTAGGTRPVSCFVFRVILDVPNVDAALARSIMLHPAPARYAVPLMDDPPARYAGGPSVPHPGLGLRMAIRPTPLVCRGPAFLAGCTGRAAGVGWRGRQRHHR